MNHHIKSEAMKGAEKSGKKSIPLKKLLVFFPVIALPFLDQFIMNFIKNSDSTKWRLIFDTGVLLIFSLIVYNLIKTSEEYKKNLVLKESFLEAVLENMSEGVAIYDIDGNLAFVNPTARKYIPENVLLHLAGEGDHFYHADGKTPLRKEDVPFFRAFQGELVHNQEIWVEPKGKFAHILIVNGKRLVTKSNQILGTLIVSHDITQRKWAEQRLEVSEQRYRSLFDYHPDAVCWLDLNGCFLSVNPAAEKLTGYESQELLHLSFTSFIVQEDREIVLKYFEKAKQGNPQNFEMNITHKNGERVAFHVTAVPIYVNRQIVGLYVIAKDTTERKRIEERMNFMAYHDSLTGLPNRRLFKDCLHQALKLATRHNKAIAVMFLDLDRFKFINDTLGHTKGDLLLKSVAKRLKGCLRDIDIISRQGGDEFTILLSDITRDEAAEVAERILHVMGQPFVLEGHECFVTPSIGITLYPFDGNKIEDLIKNADMAMYRAKEQGKNNYKFYTSDMKEATLRKMELEKGLRKALDRGEFVVYYQPQVNINSGQIIGMEALIRWHHPELGLVPPTEFISLAEETGLIIPIGEWVLRTACNQNKTWQEAGFPPMSVAINLSAAQFQDKNLVNAVAEILKETGIDPQYLELEITENIAMQNAEYVISKMQDLKHLGVRISIDDFGTGYSSLSYLKKFPIDKLKIDKSFISQITKKSDDAEIIKAIIAMANSLHLNVIAEGVEREGQLKVLCVLGCKELQGYLFSKPVPANEFAKMFLGLQEIAAGLRVEKT